MGWTRKSRDEVLLDVTDVLPVADEVEFAGSQRLLLGRSGRWVTLTMSDAYVPAGATGAWGKKITIPTGFRPPAIFSTVVVGMSPASVQAARISSAGLWCSMPSPSSGWGGSWTWPTLEPLPTNLPGVSI